MASARERSEQTSVVLAYVRASITILGCATSTRDGVIRETLERLNAKRKRSLLLVGVARKRTRRGAVTSVATTSANLLTESSRASTQRHGDLASSFCRSRASVEEAHARFRPQPFVTRPVYPLYPGYSGKV